MDNITILPSEDIGRNFIAPEYLPEGCDEYYLRYSQSALPEAGWRRLTAKEVDCLVMNHNTADNWDEILVTGVFDPNQVRNSRFFGLVRIGRLQNVTLQHHDLRVPSGITNSLIVSCDIGHDAAIHNVGYLAHYIIGDRNILFNINEMHVTDHAKFGNGILREGESEGDRIWLDLMNEKGCRRVLPFDGMIAADAWLWAKYVDDRPLQEQLKRITRNVMDGRRGYYGTTGEQCVVKNTRIIKDVKIGSCCYIKGANKLKNLTINSSFDEPTQIGEGVELVNGIIGYGCHIFYGCKAVRFIMGDNSKLTYGARLIHTFLGENSTVSCCEVLNNLIFPAHEQHHNNSFLIASLVMGQSNIAAGATVGSNHNSRAADNEIQAGRGFWPGLCTSVRHSSRFASFVLLSKGDYPAEMDIRLPFSLVNNNVTADRLEVMPAFWWMYNMYALARNSWKFGVRDKRIRKAQKVEFDPLAPDTAGEIIEARKLLEIWTAKADLEGRGEDAAGMCEHELAGYGRKLFAGSPEGVDRLEVLGEGMENSRRKALILKPYKAYHAYGDMLWYYAVKNLMAYMQSGSGKTLLTMNKELGAKRHTAWVNMGGQIMPEDDVDKLRTAIGSGKLNSWEEIHATYDELWSRYPHDKQQHGFAILCDLTGSETITGAIWNSSLGKAGSIQKYIAEQTLVTRSKDFENPFRQITFRNREEMTAAIGTVDDDSFISRVREETGEFLRQIEKLRVT